MKRLVALMGAVRTVGSGLADLFLPGLCPACLARQTRGGSLCEECGRQLLRLVALPYCPRCGSTVGPNVPVREDGCPGCPPTLPRFARVVRLGPYADPLRAAIRRLKYRRQEGMLVRLGRMLGQATAARLAEEQLDLAVPVPMHWRRRFSRGYDHSHVLARALAAEISLPVGRELARVRHTPQQAHLPKSRREENVRGAFKARSPRALAGLHVLLVDDVTTTGATANEAARTLLAGGASRVILAVLCKSEPPTAYSEFRA